MLDCLIITSAAYVGAELAAEFGALPPAFLPVGGGRLFRLQCDAVRAGASRIVLTVPSQFEILDHDRDLIRTLGIDIVRVPEGLSLGQSVGHVLRALDLGDAPFGILHGDTLLFDFDFAVADAVSVHPTEHGYRWAVEPDEADVATVDFSGGEPTEQNVLSGFFSFSQASRFVATLDQVGMDFIGAINAYEHRHGKLAHRTDGRWFDFGHLQTYYRSRLAITTQRSFNGLTVTPEVITKTSQDRDKMHAEAAWYRGIPDVMRLYTPILIESFDGAERAGYRLSNEYLSTLADLFVFGSLPSKQWHRIFGACGRFLALSAAHPPASAPPGIDGLYTPKSIERLQRFAHARELDLTVSWTINGRAVPALSAIVEHTGRIIAATPPVLGVMHGDFCFSNIFFDFRREAIKVIDPRGYIDGGGPSPYGDIRYDVAKLAHSVIGAYDFIVAGYFSAQRSGQAVELSLPESPHLAAVRRTFLEAQFAGIATGAKPVLAIVVQLFLSMLPLHADRPDRQEAFLANALRLYALLDA